MNKDRAKMRRRKSLRRRARGRRRGRILNAQFLLNEMFKFVFIRVYVVSSIITIRQPFNFDTLAGTEPIIMCHRQLSLSLSNSLHYRRGQDNCLPSFAQSYSNGSSRGEWRLVTISISVRRESACRMKCASLKTHSQNL